MIDRPEWPKGMFSEFKALASDLGYKQKGKNSRWNLLRKLMAYAREHSDIFSSR